MTPTGTIVLLPILSTDNHPKVYFTYKNYRGEISSRRVKPMFLMYGTTQHHPDKDQWFMKALDLTKTPPEVRDFAIEDMSDIGYV